MSFDRIYRAIQIGLLMQWTKIVLIIMIINLFMYNPALCAVTSENVSEFVKQDQYYINEEAERIGIWELIDLLINDRDIGVWLEDMPHRTRTSVDEVKIDGNQTCEDAAYNQRGPLPTEPLSEPITKMEASQPEQSSEESDESLLLTEEQYDQILKDLGHITDKAVSILNVSYPAVLDPNLPPTDIPDAAIKNAVFNAIMESGNISEWTAKSAAEVMDSKSTANIYLNVIQSVKDMAENPLEKRLYCHLASSICIVNSVTASVNNAEGIQIDFDAQLNACINGDFYNEVYQKFE